MTSARIAVITGSAGGIGRALLEQFSAAGYDVVGIDRRRGARRPGTFVAADLARFARDTGYRRRVIARIVALLPARRLDVLVNNAAVQHLARVERLPAERWQETLDVNVTAPYLLVQGLIEPLRRARGSVLNITSIHAGLTKRRFAAYAASKAGLEGLTRALAVELAPAVRVNALAPAAISTPLLEAGFAGRPRARRALAACHPAGRLGTPAEVAELAVMLASDRCGFLNGAIVPITGGIGARLHDPD